MVVYANCEGKVANRKKYYTTTEASTSTAEINTGVDRSHRRKIDNVHFHTPTFLNQPSSYRILAGQHDVVNKLHGDVNEPIHIRVGAELVQFKNPWGNQNDRLRRYRVSKEIYVLSELERRLIDGNSVNPRVFGGNEWLQIMRNTGDDQHLTTASWTTWDSSAVDWGCTGVKPDYILVVNGYALVVEVDEFQHKDNQNYTEPKEVSRMIQIYWELMDRPEVVGIGWIRFNPDECSGRPSMFNIGRSISGEKSCMAQEPEFSERMDVLVDTVNTMVTLRLAQSVRFLYYDHEYVVNFDSESGRNPARRTASDRIESRHHLNALGEYPGRDPRYLPNVHLNQTPLGPYFPDL